MNDDEEFADELMHLVAAEIEALVPPARYGGAQFLTWLANDLRRGMTSDERAKDEHDALRFARRVGARIAAARTARRMPARALRQRDTLSSASVLDSMARSARDGCATLLDLAVAAGGGRELWDESCEQWLELPDDIPASERYIALRVAGDSMSPILEPKDVILLKIGAAPAIDELVVARVPDSGYVVKYVSAIKQNHVELSSFNPDYETIRIPLSRHAILGTVLARFRAA